MDIFTQQIATQEVGYNPTIANLAPKKSINDSKDAISFIEKKIEDRARNIIKPHYDFIKKIGRAHV